MGYKHQRQAAARTVMRARLTKDPAVIEDAETTAEAWIDAEDLDDYITEHFPDGLPADDGGAPRFQPGHLVRVTEQSVADGDVFNEFAALAGTYVVREFIAEDRGCVKPNGLACYELDRPDDIGANRAGRYWAFPEHVEPAVPANAVVSPHLIAYCGYNPTTPRNHAVRSPHDPVVPSRDPEFPHLVVNTGGHPIAKFSDSANAHWYAQQWLGLLPPVDTSEAP